MSYMMEDEIKSQGLFIESLVNRYIINYCVLMDIPLDVKRVSIIASGSSYNAGLFGKYFLENIANTKAEVDFASDIINSTFNDFSSDVLYILISQSGNSYDTVEAMEKIKRSGAKVLCITNNLNSTLHEKSDYKFYLDVGTEDAIAATKTYSATVIMLWLIALKIAQNKHIDIGEETKNIYSIRQSIDSVVSDTDNLDYAAKFLSKQKSISITGFGLFYPLSRETSLKIKETSYINSASYPMGEFIHGHFAVLNESNVLLTFITNDACKKELELLNKILKTYKTKTILISDSYEDYDSEILIKIPKGQSKIATLMNMIVTVQLLALKTAINLKRDVDRPKGLVKVVKDEESK